MKLDQAGEQLIKGDEGCKLSPYLDTANVPTIGFGNTHYENGLAVKMTDPAITQDRANNLWLNCIATFEDCVNKNVTNDITQNQFNVLVSFTENEGEHHFLESTLLKMVNANPNDPAIGSELRKWVYSGGRVTPGLVTRREREAIIYYK